MTWVAPSVVLGACPRSLAPAGEPEDVILPAQPYALRAEGSFSSAPTGRTIAAGTPTRILRLTDQVRFNGEGRPVILAEVDVEPEPGAPRRRGFAAFTLADFRPAPGTGPALLAALLEAFRRASSGAPSGTASAFSPSTPMQASLSLRQPPPSAAPAGRRTGVIVAAVVGGGGLLATLLYLLRRPRSV